MAVETCLLVNKLKYLLIAKNCRKNNCLVMTRTRMRNKNF
jgi:hypothetical protein